MISRWCKGEDNQTDLWEYQLGCSVTAGQTNIVCICTTNKNIIIYASSV